MITVGDLQWLVEMWNPVLQKCAILYRNLVLVHYFHRPKILFNKSVKLRFNIQIIVFPIMTIFIQFSYMRYFARIVSTFSITHFRKKFIWSRNWNFETKVLISYTVGAGYSRCRTLSKIVNDTFIAARSTIELVLQGGGLKPH